MRVGLFGGSFNPIHVGHLALCDWIIAHNYVDELWLMVSPQNPLKAQSDLLDEQLRLRLAELGVRGHDKVKVSNYEFSLPRPSYTWFTLRHLSAAFPRHEFSVVIGADNWQLFHSWAHHEDILREYSLLVYPRPGIELGTPPPSSRVVFLSSPLFPQSSTEIRNLLKHGESITHLVPPQVEETIIGLHLYQ